MPEQPETRLITRRSSDGQVEISVYLPASGKETRTGMKVPAAQTDVNCRKIAETLQRAGNRVSHKEIS